VQKHKKTTLYLHNVLEAKLLGPAGVGIAIGSAFIDNADAQDSKGKAALDGKQDGALNALRRLAPRLKKDFLQAHFVLAGDSLFACGRVLALCKEYGWSYLLTFKQGHRPAVWQDFQALLPLCPRNRLCRQWSDGTRQEYRWVPDLC